MYIDIATDFLIDDKDIVGIFDLDNTTTTTSHTQNFLNEKQKQDRVVYLIKDLPKSFVLTKDGKCVGWVYDGATQLYPDYENAKIEE